ncbi:DNA topoisomerase 6 subunit B, putative [Plasmodium vivax]|uniref:DNA topoisomerase 6 subunit B, putative n=1 Tax=Plasmodium vivax TaxID=5855 RepID=A0A564ZWP6_PLAVI|nr:DNA topoisomerase 6 subunit B, putative [Plasmodium vivax]
MDKLNESSNSTYSFFFKNLSVTGFCEENALFMTVKELFDNSIDALSSVKGKGKEVQILIREYKKELSLYEIVCRDNGEGAEIKDLEKFSEIFLTSKGERKTGGKFGIGLKTILLYSFKTAYGFLHLKVRVEENKIWDFMLLIDKDLSHTFVQNFKEYVDEEWKWSIEISVILKMNSTCSVYDRRISFYMKLILLWKKDITVKCSCDGVQEFTHTCGEEHHTDDEHESLDSFVANCTNVVFRKRNLNSHNFDTNMFVNVRKSGKVDVNGTGVHMGFLFLIRYVNSMPLWGNNAADCSITKSFKSFLKLYGPQFGMELFNVENLEETYPDELISLECFKDLKEISHTFRVKKSEKSTWDIILLGIDVRGSDISFASLSKTCINEGKSLSSLISKCALGLFNSVKVDFPEEFESLADYQLRQALDIYGVHLASSLSKIILKGRNEFKNKVFFLLNEKRKEINGGNLEKDSGGVATLGSSSEKELMEELYYHIREKVLSDEKGHEQANVTMREYSSGESNVSGDEDDEDDGDDEVNARDGDGMWRG